jgi:hypothetical protein
MDEMNNNIASQKITKSKTHENPKINIYVADNFQHFFNCCIILQ